MKKNVSILCYFIFISSLQSYSQISTYVKTYQISAAYSTNSSYVRKVQNKLFLTEGGNGLMLVAEINEQGDTIKTKHYIAHAGGIGGGVIDDAGANLWLNGARIGLAPYTQIHLTKLDNNYTPLFSKVYSSPSGHLSLEYTPLADTTFLGPGYITQGNWNNPIDMAIVKLDNNGDTIWCKKYDDGGNVLVANSVIPVNSNSYIISGATDLADSSDIVLSKFDSNGIVLWAKAYGGSSREGGAIKAIINNSFYVLGGSTSFGGSFVSNGFLMKTDTLGNLKWAKSISYPNGFSPQYSQYEADKGVFTSTGMLTIPGTPYSSWDFLAMQIDTNGIVVNNKSYSFSPDDDYGLSFVKMNDGGYLFTMSEYNNSISNYDTKIFKTDSLFNSGCIPSTTLSFTTTDVTSLMHVNTLTMVASPLYIDVIDTVTFGSGRGCTIQTECSGFVGIDENNSEENIITMYPNPANDVLYFDYKLPETIAQATVNVYNYAGMLVQSFIIYGNEGTAIQNVSGLSNGLYMFSIISNNTRIAQQKIIINNFKR